MPDDFIVESDHMLHAFPKCIGYSSSQWYVVIWGALLSKTKVNQQPENPVKLTSADSPREVERLFNEHNNSLVRFLRARLRSSEEAEEVAQEAYVRLLQLDRPQTVSYIRAFLFKTASNLATDRLRRKTLHMRWSTLAFFEETAPSSEEIETQRESVSRVGDYLDELPPKCRRAFLLSRGYGLSTREIADQMCLSRRMIRIYLVKATLHCQARMDEVMETK